MYVYSTYLHVIGIIIKTSAVFVLYWEAQETECWGFNSTVNDTDTFK